MGSSFSSAQCSEQKEGSVDWPVEHEERTNEKPFNGPIPEGDWNPRKMPNSVLFPCPSAGWGDHLGRGSVQTEKVRNLLCYRGAKDGRFLQQFPPLEIKGTSLVVASSSMYVFVCV